MVKVSIIVPVYKVEKYIQKCIESLANQTESNIEIILVDDGSPDNSGKICDKYALSDSRIKVIHKANGGVSSARNSGMEFASGEYIVFVDSDDWVEKEYVETLLKAKEKYQNSEILCGYQTIDATENKVIRDFLFSRSEKESIVPFERYMDLVDVVLAQSPCNKIFKRKIIVDFKIKFDETLSLGEDFLFCLDYYYACGEKNIVCINVPIYNYTRTCGESLVNKYYPDLLEIDERIYTELKERIVYWGADDEQIKKYNNSRFFRYTNALNNTYLMGNKATPKEKRKTNNKILKSKEFKSALKNFTSYIHPIHKIAYKSGSWNIVRLAYKITSLKSLIKRGKNV